MRKLMLAFAIVFIGLNFCSCTTESIEEIEIQATEGEQETEEGDPDQGN